MPVKRSRSWTFAKTTNGQGATSQGQFTLGRESSSATSSRPYPTSLHHWFYTAEAASARHWPRITCRKWVTRTASRWTADGAPGPRRDSPPKRRRNFFSPQACVLSRLRLSSFRRAPRPRSDRGVQRKSRARTFSTRDALQFTESVLRERN